MMGHEFKNTERRQMEFFDWSSDDFKKLVYHPMNTDRDSAILHTLRSSGIRAAELCGLTHEDVDLEQKWLYIRVGKGNKDGYAPIDDEAKVRLHLYMPSIKLHSKEPWLFQNEDFKQLTPKCLWQIIRRKVERLGIVGSPQTFRRSLGGELIQRGADITVVQQVLRHDSAQTTSRHYVRFKKGRLKEQYDKYIPKMSNA
jgi:site-specific recombinase XerD